MTVLIAALWGMPSAHAGTEVGDPRPLGLGIQLGTLSGLSGKYYLGNRERAVDFGLGAGLGNTFYSNFHVHATFSQHFPALVSGDGVTIPWRVGIGGWLNSGGYWLYNRYNPRPGAILGARVPVGLDFDLEDVPLQFFVEAAFNLAVFPGIWAGVDAGLGVRYYF